MSKIFTLEIIQGSLKHRTLYCDILFIFLIEVILFLIYLLGPTPTQFPLDITNGFQTLFSENVSQFFAIGFIPYLPEILFHIYNLNIGMFLGISILWTPSLLVLIWLIRQLFVKALSLPNFKFYYAYFPILFTIFMPHTLLEIFTFNGSHPFAGLSEFFIMFISILSAILFYINGEKKFIVIAATSILLINYQEFSFSFFLISLFLLVFSVFCRNIGKSGFRSFLLILISIIASLVYLYVSSSITFFPYTNLSIPNIGPTDPNGRVFILSIFSRYRGIWNVFLMQNYVNDPYFPMYYPHYIYNALLFIVTSVSLFPFLFFNNKLRRVGLPIYLSLIALEIMNSFANPFISLVFPQNIGVFYDLSFVFNNNTVFYFPLQIIASLTFLFSVVSFPAFLRFVITHLRKILIIEIMAIDRRIERYWKPALAIVFALLMISPLLSNIEHNNYSDNSVPYGDYVPFITYFNTQHNASVYFDTSAGNKLLCTLQSDIPMIENPQLTLEQTCPFSTAMSFINSVSEKLQPGYIAYLLHMFRYNFIITSNSSLSETLGHSGLFSLVLNHSGVQVLRLSKIEHQDKLVLLSSSVKELLNLINGFGIFPIWIYSPYLLNINSLESIFNSDIPVYAPSYTTVQNLFHFINGSSYLIPARYTANSFYSNKWEIGYLPPYSQETWSQNIASLKNYSYQSELNVNYGYIFTSAPNVSLDIHYSLPAGNYAVLVNYLKSNIGGEFSIDLSGNSNPVYTKNSSSFFLTNYLTSYTSNGDVNFNITNINGFNTVSYLTFVPYLKYLAFTPSFNKYIDSASMNSIYALLGIKNIYNITITAPQRSNNLTYEQSLKLNLSQLSKNINANLSNILFTYSDGTPIYAFISSITLRSSRTADVWIRLLGEFTRVIHIIVFSNKISFLGDYIGEAPNISPVYGQYFNAPFVFRNSSSSNAWDWANSYEGWNTMNPYATYINDGMHVNGTLNGKSTLNGGVFLPEYLPLCTSFTAYGWTKNDTEIGTGSVQFGAYNNYYTVEDFPNWTLNTSIPERAGIFHYFTLQRLANNTLKTYLDDTRYFNSADPYPVYSKSYIFLREGTNDPQYFEYAFIRTLPIGGIMPQACILS